jgi:hypothetical protein
VETVLQTCGRNNRGKESQRLTALKWSRTVLISKEVQIALQRGGTQLLTVHSRRSRGNRCEGTVRGVGRTGLGAAADTCPRVDGYWYGRLGNSKCQTCRSWLSLSAHWNCYRLTPGRRRSTSGLAVRSSAEHRNWTALLRDRSVSALVADRSTSTAIQHLRFVSGVSMLHAAGSKCAQASGGPCCYWLR